LLTLAAALYFAETKRWRWFWVAILITLGFKEIFVGLLAGVGCYLILQRQWRQGLTAIAISLAYYFVATRMIIPYFSGQPYGYPMPAVSLATMVTGFFWPALKLKTILISLITFGALPIVGGAVLPLLGQDLFIRFVLGTPHAWDLTLHYSAMMSIILYFGAIKGAEFLNQFAWYRSVAFGHGVLIVIAATLLHYRLHGALGLVYNRAFYTQTAGHAFLDRFIEQIPNSGLVMTQNNLAVKLLHTHQIMLLRDDYWRWMPNVIAIDIREGQSPNNYWPINPGDLYRTLKQDPNYQLHQPSEQQIYFTKKADPDMNFYTPKLQTQ